MAAAEAEAVAVLGQILSSERIHSITLLTGYFTRV
jgi:hypothetical protein